MNLLLDWKHKVLLGLIGTSLIGGVLAFSSWLTEHDLRLHAEEQSKAKQEIIEQNQKALQQLGELVKQVREDNARQVEALNRTVAALKTPDQQLAWVVSQLKTAPGQAPITINVPKDEKQPATISVPQARIGEVTEAVKGCEQCKLDLSAARQEISYSEQQKQKLNESLKAMADERDTWKKAAKGGSFWTRFKRGAKWFAIGVGAGAVAVCGTGHCR